jgi:exodeoxyribonuclease VII small subunit
MTDPKKDVAPAAVAAAPEISKLSFEEAMAELDRIVRQIEEGRGELDQAITAYERGVALKRHCEAKLKEAEARIEKITINAEGGLTASAFDN